MWPKSKLNKLINLHISGAQGDAASPCGLMHRLGSGASVGLQGLQHLEVFQSRFIVVGLSQPEYNSNIDVEEEISHVMVRVIRDLDFYRKSLEIRYIRIA